MLFAAWPFLLAPHFLSKLTPILYFPPGREFLRIPWLVNLVFWMPLHVQVNSACPTLPTPALISPETLCPLLSYDPVWFHPPCMLLILCDSVSSSTHFPAQSHCAYGLRSPGPWLKVKPENPGRSVNFHLGLHPRLLPRSFQVRFFIAIVVIWLFKFLRLGYIKWTYLGPFNGRGLVGGLIDPPDFWWSCIKTFTSVPPVDTLFIS